MNKNDPLVASFIERVGAQIHILIIEDRAGARKMLRSLLCSPLIRITEASSYASAQQQITGNKAYFDCWVVDIELGDGSGLEILKKYPNYPFKVVVSGLKSMSIATDATKNGGAFAAIDKDDPLLVTKYSYRICDLAALGFLLHGECLGREDIFFSLITNPEYRVVEDWADGNIMVPRRLEQMCRLYAKTSPAKFMKLFHCLSYALGRTGIDQGRHQYANPDHEQIARDAFESILSEWEIYESFFTGKRQPLERTSMLK